VYLLRFLTSTRQKVKRSMTDIEREIQEIKNELKDLSKRVENIEKQIKEDKEEQLKRLKAEVDYAKFRCTL